MKKIILAGVLATMMGSAPVMAATATTTTPAQATTANVQKEAADIMQVAVQGANAMRDIQLARLALFHGQPDSAKKLTDDAASLLAGDSKLTLRSRCQKTILPLQPKNPLSKQRMAKWPKATGKVQWIPCNWLVSACFRPNT